MGKDEEKVEVVYYKLWQVVKLAETQALGEVLAIKTNMKNIMFMTKVQKGIIEAYKIYVEARNTFIELNSPDKKSIDQKSEVFQVFMKQMNELLLQPTEVKAITEYIFTRDELEEKSIELSYNQCVALKAAHILDIEIDVPDDAKEVSPDEEEEEYEEEYEEEDEVIEVEGTIIEE